MRLMPMRIIKNHFVLRESYIPEYLPCRDRHVNRLKENLKSVLDSIPPEDMHLFGPTGTGKTVVSLNVKQSFSSVDKKALGSLSSVIIRYVNCHNVNSAYRVMINLVKAINPAYPNAGPPYDQICSDFAEYMAEHGYIFVVILDEVDLLIRRDGDRLLYTLKRLQDLGEGSISLVTVSNDMGFMGKLSSRVKSSYSPEMVRFDPYKASELELILKQRAERGLRKGSWDEAAISYISAIVAKNHNGDARKAIDLLHLAAKTAERNGSPKLGVPHVKEALSKMKHDTVEIKIRTLPPQKILVLEAIAKLKHEGGKAYTGTIYDVYYNIARLLGFTPLSMRSVAEIIKNLDELGILTSDVMFRGRYGNTRGVLSLALNPKEVLAIIEDLGFLVPRDILERYIKRNSPL